MLEKRTFRVTLPSKLTLPVREEPFAQLTNQVMAHAANLGSPDPKYAAELLATVVWKMLSGLLAARSACLLTGSRMDP